MTASAPRSPKYVMNLPYPKTFPTPAEEAFLNLVLCGDTDFPHAWKTWKEKNDFDDIEPGTLLLVPQLYLRMQKLAMQSDSLFGRIKGIYRSAWVKNQSIIAGAKQFIAMCKTEHIPVILLKGIPIITEVYQDLGARFSGDADVLVHPRHAGAIITMLGRNGWHSIDRAPGVPESAYHVFRTETFKAKGFLEIDVHWNPYEIDLGARFWDIITLKPLPMFSFRETSWHDAIAMRLGEQDCLRPSNEDLLIHILVHGSGMSPHRELRWVADAVAALGTLAIDWNRLVARSRDYGTMVDTIVGLTYLRERFTDTIPDHVIDQLHASAPEPRDIRNYYRKMRKVKRYGWFGTVPLIWYAYWKFEPRKNGKKGFWGIVRYACKVWGLPSLSHLPRFIIGKYLLRVTSQ